MPNYKPKMHMRNPAMWCSWEEWSFTLCNGWHVSRTEQTTSDRAQVTCGNCLRCRKKGERDGT